MSMPSPAMAMAMVAMAVFRVSMAMSLVRMIVSRVSTMAVTVVTVAMPRVIISCRSANTALLLLNHRQPSVLRNKQQRSRYDQDHQIGHHIASRLFFGS